MQTMLGDQPQCVMIRIHSFTCMRCFIEQIGAKDVQIMMALSRKEETCQEQIKRIDVNTRSLKNMWIWG